MTAGLRIGARTSPLARAQVDLVAALLAAARRARPTFVGITTRGDVDSAAADRDRRHRGLRQCGPRGAARRARSTSRCTRSRTCRRRRPRPEIVAVPGREDTRDVLVGSSARRPATTGSGSAPVPRAGRAAARAGRAAQGIEIEIVPIRGNVDTRIDLVATGAVDAVLLAAAGLRRLGTCWTLWRDPPTQTPLSRAFRPQCLSRRRCCPRPDRVRWRWKFHESLESRPRANRRPAGRSGERAESLAERGFLATLEAGCTAPVGARAVVKSVRGTSLDLTLTAVIGRTLSEQLVRTDQKRPIRPRPLPSPAARYDGGSGAVRCGCRPGSADGVARRASARRHVDAPIERRAPNTERENPL